MSLISDQLELPPQLINDDQEYDVFRSLRMPNGTYKTTRRGRLHALDQATLAALEDRSRIRILDVGCSSAVTTVDLLDACTAAGISATAVGADLFVHARVRKVGGWLTALTHSADRNPIEVVVFGLHVPNDTPTPGRPLSYARRLTMAVCGSALAFTGGPARDARPRLLASPRARRADLTLEEQDIFADRPGWRGQFDVVRAANVLNRAYFSEARIREALRLLASYLRPGGVLVIARSDDVGAGSTGSLDATIVRGGYGALQVVTRLGAGSEVEALLAR